MRDVKNIVSNALRLGAGGELIRKAAEKCLNPAENKKALHQWCEEKATPVEDWLKADQMDLWEESKAFAARVTEEGQKKLEALQVELGGGGHYGLLYFLTRTLKPNIVLETGVAAGFSSLAVLTALKKNGTGKLYSSDFPYCRLEKPEKYIGILVDEELKDRWELHIKGDRENLPAIVSKLEPESIGLFHYDSDKSQSGRAFAYNTVSPYLSKDSICIFDDIQNNWHFRELIESNTFNWRVFEFGGKYLGLVERTHTETS